MMLVRMAPGSPRISIKRASAWLRSQAVRASRARPPGFGTEARPRRHGGGGLLRRRRVGVLRHRQLEAAGVAHEAGLRTTSTIIFGQLEQPVHWSRHLLRRRDLQSRTGGLTAFVRPPFVPMEAPFHLRGRFRAVSTLREAVLMHAVGRLALHAAVANVQARWVKLGEDGVRLCLEAGANDFGGTLMDESISRAAGAAFVQDMAPRRIEAAMEALGRVPRQRGTLCDDASAAPRLTARQACETPEA